MSERAFPEGLGCQMPRCYVVAESAEPKTEGTTVFRNRTLFSIAVVSCAQKAESFGCQEQGCRHIKDDFTREYNEAVDSRATRAKAHPNG